MTLDERQLDRLNTWGYIIIDDFLPMDFYKALLHELKLGRTEPCLQIRPDHYKHVFKGNFKTLPSEEEAYVAKFSLVKGGEMLKVVFQEWITPLLKQATENRACFALYPNAIKLKSGDTFRAHQDGYAGIVGFSYFLNDGWKHDYGGVLTYVRGEAESETIFPLANRLLLRNESFKTFHFLNTIEQFCTAEQFIVLGWADSKKGETSKLRGDYRAI